MDELTEDIRKKPVRTVDSYGIACFRTLCSGSNNRLQHQVLMTRRDYTYAFFDFIGVTKTPIDYYDDAVCMEHLANMTNMERKMLTNLNFESLWKLAWNRDNSKINTTYIHYKYNEQNIEYTTAQQSDNRKRLFKMIEQTYHLVNDIVAEQNKWSIPKGRKHHQEKHLTLMLANDVPATNETLNSSLDPAKLQIALREFEEETGFSSQDYRILNNFKNEYFQDNKYKIEYFIAIYTGTSCNSNNDDIPINIIKNYDHYTEVSALRWMTIEDLMIWCPALHTVLQQAFTYYKKTIKTKSTSTPSPSPSLTSKSMSNLLTKKKSTAQAAPTVIMTPLSI